MLLVSNKAPTFEIVIAPDAPPAVHYAAEELRRYVDRLSLGFPNIRSDGAPSAANAAQRVISVGANAASRVLFPGVSIADLGREGYVLKAQGGNILIQGSENSNGRGTLYGVYDFLERLGVRWWAPDAETVPVRPTLEIDDKLDARFVPPLIYRATWYRHAMNADWLARVRLDAGTMGPVHLTDRHGGMERFAADASGHTYEGLVPTHEYFDTHPEYFCEVKGQRLRHMNQLCPTHPDVARIAADNARKWLDSTPDANIISVTQNDWGNWCTCATCSAMLAKTEAPSGPALHLANEIARLLESTHPHALIDTFAYAWTQTPPKNIKAHPNVLVRIAPIGNCFGHPIRTCKANKPCLDAVKAWSDIAQHLFVWHYVADFFHYLTPFPNLPPLHDDIRFYIEHGVKGIFMQGDGTSLGGDMAELKAYMIAKLLWNPSLKAASVRKEFIDGYYRAAGPAVEEYLELFERTLAKSKGEHLHLYRSLGENTASYLKKPVLSRGRGAVASGRRLASDDPIALERLDRIEAGLDYTELFYHERPKPRVLRGKAVECRVSPRRKVLVDRLFTNLERRRVTHYAEDLGRYTTVAQLRGAWQTSTGKHNVVKLEGGGSRLLFTPAIGGRILSYGPSKESVNLLADSLPRTFGYPCTGGYEEYSLRNHQSPGFSQPFNLIKNRTTPREATVSATMETGLLLTRRMRLDPRSGEAIIDSTLSNWTGTTLPGCMRSHLEIDLCTPPKEVEIWILRAGRWTRDTTSNPMGFAWYESQVPDGWMFWSEQKKLGLYQTWSRKEVDAVYFGAVVSETTTLALDLARSRYNLDIPHGEAQTITHRFKWLRERPPEAR